MITSAAVLIWIVLGALALFQGLLVLGAPLGRFAWGGQHRVLPVSQRIGSLGVPTDIVGIAIWVVAAYFIIAIGLNLGSKSKSERSVMPAVSAVLCVLCVVVALR